MSPTKPCREEEAALRAAVLRGDERAWRALYEAAFEQVAAYVRWRCAGDAEAAAEVLQETWLVAVRRIRAFRPQDGPFAGWVCGIAANVLRAEARRQARRNKWRALAAAGQQVSGNDHPAGHEDRRAECVRRALSCLPDDYEQILRAKYLDRLSVREIAQQLGRTPKAIESMLSRARQAFRNAYFQEAGAEE